MKRKLSESEVSLTINLREKLGGIADNPEIKDAIGQDIINRILDRTENENRDVNGKLFAPYSKSYINSLAFQSFDKSPRNVNLRLTGDMLSSLVPSSEGDDLIISVSGDNNILKAFGNITGERGNSKGAKRDFFGISEKDLNKILDNYKPSLADSLTSDATSLLNQKILKALGVDDGEED